MNSEKEKEQTLHSQPQDNLQSPFLEEELFVGESEAELEAHLVALEAESPLLNAFDPVGSDGIRAPEPEKHLMTEVEGLEEFESLGDEVATEEEEATGDFEQADAEWAQEGQYVEQENEPLPDDSVSPEEEAADWEGDALDEVLEAETEGVDDEEDLEFEGSRAIPSGIAEFAANLSTAWARHDPARTTAWHLADYQDTLAGARRRWKDKFGRGRFTVASIGRAWMISRQEQMRFETSATSGVRALQSFRPPADSVALISSSLIQNSDRAPVAPIVVRFVEELARRSQGSVHASTYRGHGGGRFKNRGYSIDLYLGRQDERGFYQPQEAIRFLRALQETATATNVEWRVLYNDFTVADAINGETGKRHVVFMGTVRRDSGGQVTGLNWHGPAPLILHLHLDLVPIGTTSIVGVSTPSGTATASATQPAVRASVLPPELVRFAQRVLNVTGGERLAEDGILGRLTRGALERFRTKYKLGDGGVLDEKTQLALAQRALEEIRKQSLFGQYGVLDTTTRQNLVAFKAERGLRGDAAIDANTRAALLSALT